MSNTNMFYFNEIKPETLEDKIKRLRAERECRLIHTDWTQLADVPQTVKDKYAPYRQELRDITTTPGWPDNVVWPVKPV